MTEYVERAEYEKLKKENVELKIKYDDAEKRFCHAMDEKAKLRSKIDNAIEEIEQAIKECELRWASIGMKYVLEILKRNIGE